MSAGGNEGKLFAVQSAIIKIAEEATSESEEDHAHSLLKLKDILRDSTLSSRTLHEAYTLIWKCDLIHIIVETLRQDFTNTHGQWYTAVGLARTLATVCGALHPNTASAGTGPNSTIGYDKDEVAEYYDMLLPAATDSLLILANNIHQFEHSFIDTPSPAHSVAPPILTAPSVYLDQFEAVTDALIRLCSAHITCVHRIVQSSYLLHLLVTDNHTYSLSVLTSLHELVILDEQVIGRLSTQVLQSLLDELVYKVGGAHQDAAVMSLRLLALFSSKSGAIVDIISERYRGLSVILQKWSKSSMDSSMLKFVSTLLERVRISDEKHRLYKAATVIQSAWRGYITRVKLKRMEQGIRLFQRLYRKRNAERKRQKFAQSQTGQTLRREQMTKILTNREQHEQQMALLKQLPASSFGKYLTEQKNKAATRIQSWWRGVRDRKQFKQMRILNKLVQSAVIIQRAYRRHLKRRQAPSLVTVQGLLQRGDLYQALSSHEDRPKERKSELATMLEWFHASRNEQRENDQRRDILITQLNSQCDQLLNMPSLASSTRDTVTQFCSGSQAIAAMAERAHKEELVSMNLPWWKRKYDRTEIQL